MDELKMAQLEQLHPFPENPYGVRDDAEMEALVDSVREFGVINPLLVRPKGDGAYEILSGHRRLEACMRAGVQQIPVIVREMDDDSAVIAVVDGNMQRENVLPSEKAKAYQMKLEAVKRKAGRKKNGAQHEPHKRAAQLVADEVGESAAQVKRYIRLNNLEKPLMDMVDSGKVALTPAVQLSYLPADKQNQLAQAIQETDSTPSLSQAMRLREMDNQGKLSEDAILDVMSEEKGNQKELIRIPRKLIDKYLPPNVTDREITGVIVHALDAWYHRQNRKHQEPIR